MAAKLPKTKNLIQNVIIVIAVLYLFGTSAAGFFAPQFVTNGTGTFTDFQQLVLDNSSILIVVVISGAITAIGLGSRGTQETELVSKFIGFMDKYNVQANEKTT